MTPVEQLTSLKYRPRGTSLKVLTPGDEPVWKYEPTHVGTSYKVLTLWKPVESI